jgi:hypothetical protein
MKKLKKSIFGDVEATIACDSPANYVKYYFYIVFSLRTNRLPYLLQIKGG